MENRTRSLAAEERAISDPTFGLRPSQPTVSNFVFLSRSFLNDKSVSWPVTFSPLKLHP
jgi:hypothetical protein